MSCKYAIIGDAAWPADLCVTESAYGASVAVKIECGSGTPQYLAGPNCDSLTVDNIQTAFLGDDNCDDVGYIVVGLFAALTVAVSIM